MDPEKFRLANEGVAGESKGLFLDDQGKIVPKTSFHAEINSHDALWWKIRAFLSTVAYLTIMEPEFFPFQVAENFSDALHDMILSPMGGGRLSVGQCKVAWKTMIAQMHIKIYQTGATLSSLVENEMFWKHHWAYHSGPGSQGGGSSQSSDKERRLQSLLDKADSALKRNANGQPIKRGGRNGGGKGDGGKKGFNANIPPPPNAGAQGAGEKQKALNQQMPWGKKGKKQKGKK